MKYGKFPMFSIISQAGGDGRAPVRRFSNGWKIFFQWLENPGLFFQ